MTAEDRQRLLDRGEFRALFIEELGWSKPDRPPLDVEVDGIIHRMEQAAGFHGVRVWVCAELPDRRTQRLIDAEVRKVSNERLIIFTDGRTQEWRWPQSSDVRGTGQPRLITHEHRVGRANPALDQRLQLVTIDIDEEPTVVELLRRLRSAFDAEKVTKSFYDKFLTKHQDLVAALKGLREKGDREWYSALLMNRLMFVYFMQRKGFMDGDLNYLRTRLAGVQDLLGKGHFYEFFKDFLLPLFHEGLGSPAKQIKDERILQLIGDVPYINGGIFAVHPLEEANMISVPDKVFVEIFDLFDAYQWHLDDRPSGDPNEINPDVLGYIFEQFINQKEQGAYYTKEDVTHFMTASTLLPVFLERLEKETGINAWLHVTADPDRYIWESLGYGREKPLPEAVEAERDQSRRPAWNALATEEHAHPGETWWEVVHRRDAYDAIQRACKNGDINSVDAAVTVNLDLESLVIDVIDHIDAPSDVVAVWRVLSGLRIIDPTCGSGAFLFAALKVLQSLYAAVLDVATVHAQTSGDKALKEILDTVAGHPNQSYFILKHATLSNLYGVDLMHEAVEIARLRLFLKLVSAIETRRDVEPLPDLDFNIKPGNILVGAHTPDEIERHSDDLLSANVLDEVLAEAAKIGTEYRAFRAAQEVDHLDEVRAHRATLVALLATVRSIVDRHYFEAQGNRGGFDKWRLTHQPFHWFVEYPEIMIEGGFDVVIGNPPYVAKKKVKNYAYRGFTTDSLPDIYAPCTERAAQVTRPDGRLSLIVPISAQFGADFAELRKLLEARFSDIWVSTYSRNPAALFSAGLGVRSTILVCAGRRGNAAIHVTKTHRWYDDFRPALFETLTYTTLTQGTRLAGWVRVTGTALQTLFERLIDAPGTLGHAVRPHGASSIGFKQTCLYWLSVFLDDPPAYDLDCSRTDQTKIGRLRFEKELDALLAVALTASKLAFVWWYCTGDDFDVTGDGLRSIPIDPTRLSAGTRKELVKQAERLIADFDNHMMFTKYAGKWMGNYVHSEMRDITDTIDAVLAEELNYVELLPALEHAYYCVYKPTGDRPGTLRNNPCLAVNQSLLDRDAGR